MIFTNIERLFIDVGYTICFPLSGNWRFTKKFLECIDVDQFNKIDDSRKTCALKLSNEYLFSHHCISTLDEEFEQNLVSYSIIANYLQELKLSKHDIYEIAKDRTYNMNNYSFYPNVIESLNKISRHLQISIISDAWPSTRLMLKETGIWKIIDTCTLSCDLGICKPRVEIYQHALNIAHAIPQRSIFIDDLEQNLKGAANIGLQPIKILTVDKRPSKFPTILQFSDLQIFDSRVNGRTFTNISIE